MPEATYSNPPVDFETGTNSSVDAGYRVAHRVEGFDSPISAIRIFGIQALFSGGWSPANGVDPLNFEVKFYNDNGGTVGSEITAAAQTVALNHVNTGETFATSYIVYHWDFVPESPITGLPSTFWVSFANTDANAWFLWIDQPGGLGSGMQYTEEDGTWDYTDYGCGICLVPQLAEPEAPEAPTSFRAVPADLGVVYADIFWTNPSKTVAGDELTELTSVSLFLSGEEDPIYVNDSPVIGGEDTFAFTGTDVGMYTFSIYGTNSAGDGLTAGLSVWLGPDAPAAPTNVLLTGIANGGQITWTAPSKGIHGGYINPADTKYKIVRMPGAVVVADEYEGTSYTDIFNPSVGNYYYTVTASNEVGEGGTGTSNVALLGAEGILLYEPFTGIAVGQLPAGWTVVGLGTTNWSVQNSNSAGGTAPELRLSWSPSFNGVSRLVTHTFGTDGREELRLKFRHYLNNFAVTGQTLAIQASFDNGDWVDVWTHTVAGSLPAQQVVAYFDVPAGATTMKLCFKYQGDSYQINYWYIDDVVVEPVVDNDLAAISLAGSATPTVGMDFNYTVTIQNSGTATQSNYTVKLMKQGGVELASVDGEEIAFAEIQQYVLTWTPSAADEGPISIYGFIDFEDDEIQGNNQTALKPIVVQPEGTVVATIGEGDLNLYMPFNMLYTHSIAQTLYYPEEIGIDGGIITGLQYTNNFNEPYDNRQIKIWIGETELPNLADSWVDPSTLQLVYDGTYDFPSGNNDIFIALDDFYAYGGGTLVIYTWRTDNGWSGSKYFKGSTSAGSNRSRRAQQDTAPYDPMNPPSVTANHDYPNIKIFFSTAGLGALEGTVTDGTDPLEGALVKVLGTNFKTYSGADGTYSFPFILADTYDVEFSLHGYFTYVEEDVVIEADETTNLDVELDAIPQYTVNGTVMGNDGIVIVGGTVNLTGYEDYSAVTNAEGEFTIANVYEGTYTVSVSVIGYDPYVEEADVDDDTTLEILLIEIIVPPFGLVLEETENPDEILFSWNNILGTEMFEDFEGGVLPSGWSQIQNNYDQSGPSPGTWTVTSYSSTTFAPFGTYHVGLWWSYSHQDEWLITPELNIGPTYELEFWSAVYFGSTYGDHYYVKISTDGGNTWTVIWDASTLYGGWNYYNTPIVIDLAAYVGQDVHFAFHAEDPPSNDGLWYVWFLDNISLGPEGAKNTLDFANFYRYSGNGQGNYSDIADVISKDGETLVMPGVPAKAKSLVGYNVYLDGNLLTEEPIAEEEYLLTDLLYGDHIAGVQSVYTTGESEIVTILFSIPGPPVYTVTFTVFDVKTEEALEGVEITIDTEVITTNADGIATIELPDGPYSYTADAGEGYEVFTGEFTVEGEDLAITVPMDPVGITPNVLASLSVYPNPFGNSIMLNNAQRVCRLTVNNIIGQKVLELNLSGAELVTIPTEGLRRGIYLMVFEAENGERIVKKMIKE